MENIEFTIIKAGKVKSNTALKLVVAFVAIAVVAAPTLRATVTEPPTSNPTDRYKLKWTDSIN